MLPIKSLYFEAGSKRLEPGEEKKKWFVGYVFDHQMVVFHTILTIFALNHQYMSILWCSLIPCGQDIKILEEDFYDVIANERY